MQSSAAESTPCAGPTPHTSDPAYQIAWAKLRVLRDGAAIASKQLWS